MPDEDSLGRRFRTLLKHLQEPEIDDQALADEGRRIADLLGRFDGGERNFRALLNERDLPSIDEERLEKTGRRIARQLAAASPRSPSLRPSAHGRRWTRRAWFGLGGAASACLVAAVGIALSLRGREPLDVRDPKVHIVRPPARSIEPNPAPPEEPKQRVPVEELPTPAQATPPTRDAPAPPPATPDPAPTPAPAPLPDPEPVQPPPEPAAPVAPTREERRVVAVLEGVENRVLVHRSDGTQERASRGASLHPGDSVELSAGTAALSFMDGTRLDLDGPARLALPEEDGGVMVNMGRVEVHVPRRPRGRQWTVTTPHALVEVLGTRFSMLCDPELTFVHVSEGTVQVRREGQRGGARRLRAGRFSVIRGTGVEIPQALSHSDGLVACWDFSTDTGAVALDLSGRGYHGRTVGAARRDGALWFDGRDAHVAVDRQLPIGDEFSVSAWFRSDEQNADAVLFSCLSPDQSGDCVEMVLSGKDALFARMDLTPHWPKFRAWGGPSVPAGKWRHAALVYDGRRLVVHEMGEPVGELEILNQAPFSGRAMIGRSAAGWLSLPFRGSIREVRVYDRALTSRELQALSNR